MVRTRSSGKAGPPAAASLPLTSAGRALGVVVPRFSDPSRLVLGCINAGGLRPHFEALAEIYSTTTISFQVLGLC